MRILHIITGLNRGGAENFLLRLSNEQASKNNKVLIISLSNLISFSRREYSEKIKLKIFDIRKTPIQSFYLIRREINLFKPDKIFSWMYHSNSLAFIFCFPRNLKLLTFNIRHSINKFNKEDFLTKISILLNSIFSYFISATVFNSNNALEQHRKILFGFKNSYMIHNGFKITDLKNTPTYQKEIILKNLGITPKKIIIGNIGRYHPMKNQMNLVRAFIDSKVNNSILLFVGKNIPKLRHDAIASGIESQEMNNIFFFDETSDISKFYQILDFIYVVSDYGEGFPNVIVEAMQFGIIPICTNVGDASYIVGRDCLINDFSQNSIQSFIKNSEILLINKEEISTYNFNRIREEFNISSISKKFLDLVEP